jgi:hypothetical protein
MRALIDDVFVAAFGNPAPPLEDSAVLPLSESDFDTATGLRSPPTATSSTPCFSRRRHWHAGGIGHGQRPRRVSGARRCFYRVGW